MHSYAILVVNTLLIKNTPNPFVQKAGFGIMLKTTFRILCPHNTTLKKQHPYPPPTSGAQFVTQDNLVVGVLTQLDVGLIFFWGDSRLWPICCLFIIQKLFWMQLHPNSPLPEIIEKITKNKPILLLKTLNQNCSFCSLWQWVVFRPSTTWLFRLGELNKNFFLDENRGRPN